MTRLDASLLDPVFLRLAARRALHRRTQSDWQNSVGLGSLLAAARCLPPQPCDEAEIDDRDEGSGLARLLAEARRRQAPQAGDHEAR